MSENTKIQWTDHTWNPWHGCKKVSAGCKYCYMYRDKERYKKDPAVVVRSKTGFNTPLQWYAPAKVFTCSWSDWFIEEADAWRDAAWAIIKATPWLTYQILTKRPERIVAHLPADWGEGYTNVWLGVSVENQATADERIPQLARIPAAIRFLSCEPLLEPLDLLKDYPVGKGSIQFGALLDWVIVGGESGNNTGNYRYRPCAKGWILEIIRQCEVSSTPVFVKQMGTEIATRCGYKDRHGGNIDEWPAELQIRQFPK